MSELFDGLFNSEIADTIAGYVLLFGSGLFLYIANWVILFNNMKPGSKWSSMVPPLGGLLIAVGILLIGGGWWALVGLTDPFIFVFVYSLVKPYERDHADDLNNGKDKKEADENGDKNENGKHSD